MSTTILPTSNEAWGFWGTIGHHADQSKAWALAMTAIGTETGCAPEAVRDFLYSRHGRQFADDVANSLFAGLGLPAAIDDAVERWIGWRIGKPTEREYGIPRDLPYLTGWVMNREIEMQMSD
ncbi:MAG: hypothetical protein HWD60_00555 [Defluviicoccus sp.]|nr:MAG: hypothetical protein HWD60_00555 [Defluviicoccus sp.]